MSLILYGIANCDTVKKARVWLDQHGAPFAFHDYKKQGLDPESLARWCAGLGWDAVLNRAGTTFRALPEAHRAELTEAKAIALMLAQTSMIKRLILEGAGVLLAGFKPEAYAAALGKS